MCYNIFISFKGAKNRMGEIAKAQWRIFHLITYKIVTGIFRPGEKILSQAEICDTYKVSDQTARIVLQMLEGTGMVQRCRGRAARVIHDPDCWTYNAQLTYVPMNLEHTRDILYTSCLIVPPFVTLAVEKYSREQVLQLDRILEELNELLDAPIRFWRTKQRFWQTLEAQAGNHFYMQVRYALGLFDFRLPTNEIREKQVLLLRLMYKAIHNGDCSTFQELIGPNEYAEWYQTFESQHFEEINVPKQSPLVQGPCAVRQRLQDTEKRYQTIYLDIISWLALRGSTPGELLPPHEELAAIFGVSHNSTVPALRILQDLGVAKSIRGKGTFLQMSTAEIRLLRISTDEAILRVRRLLEQFQFLSLTTGAVAGHAMASVSGEEFEHLRDRMEQDTFLGPQVIHLALELQKFFTQHIQPSSLRTIFEVLEEEIPKRIGMPGLLNYDEALLKDLEEDCWSVLKYLEVRDYASATARFQAFYEVCYNRLMCNIKQTFYWEATQQLPDYFY